jgi:hypothetical protein
MVWFLFMAFTSISQAAGFDCLDVSLKPVAVQTLASSPVSDFAVRDSLPRTEVDPGKWRQGYGSFGPCTLPYPTVIFPAGVNEQEWKRIRVIEAAKKLIGVPYGHFHFPEMGGIDCSNYTALVYNYAFGLRFSSNVERQALEAGRSLAKGEVLRPGDLLFLHEAESSRIVHVAIYVNETTVIDAAGERVQFRELTGRYKTDFAWARRVLE